MAFRVTTNLGEDVDGLGKAGDLVDVADFSKSQYAYSYAHVMRAQFRGQDHVVTTEVGWVPNFDAQIIPGN